MVNRPSNKTTKLHALAIDVPLLAALAAMLLATVVAQVPAGLLLPGIAAAAFIVSGVTALLGALLRVDRRASHVTIHDFAGACLFVGVAAGIFSEPLQISQFFGVAMAAP